MTAAVPLDWQLTDTYFVVAHLHYVLLGINVFPVVGGIYYWFPKIHRPHDERAARPLGLLDHVHRLQPRLLPDAHRPACSACRGASTPTRADMGWNTVNMITSVGSFVFAIGVLIFLVDVVLGLRRGPKAGDNPWDAPTLEWSVPSPPPPYNFAVIPIIASRHPLWEDRLEESDHRSSLDRGVLLHQGKETVGSTMLDAVPNVVLHMPQRLARAAVHVDRARDRVHRPAAAFVDVRRDRHARARRHAARVALADRIAADAHRGPWIASRNSSGRCRSAASTGRPPPGGGWRS